MHYLAEYQTFDTAQELNRAIYEHIKRNTYELNETDRIALKAIARYAVKFPGVAHLKAATIASLIDKSEKTARRIVNKLAQLGIVEKVATTRKVSGGKGANIIVIQRVQSTVSTREQAENPTDNTNEPTKIENEPSDLIKHNQKTHIDTAIPANALKNSLPSEIYNAITRFFNDAESVYKYYGVLIRAKASVDPTILLEDNPQPFVEAWNATILKAKQGRIKRMCDYLFAAWKQAALTVVRKRKASRLVAKLDEWFDS